MSIKFIFDYLDSQRVSIETNLEEAKQVYGAEDNDYSLGYLQALYDFEHYLKQAIELTKNDKLG